MAAASSSWRNLAAHAQALHHHSEMGVEVVAGSDVQPPAGRGRPGRRSGWLVVVILCHERPPPAAAQSCARKAGNAKKKPRAAHLRYVLASRTAMRPISFQFRGAIPRPCRRGGRFGLAPGRPAARAGSPGRAGAWGGAARSGGQPDQPRLPAARRQPGAGHALSRASRSPDLCILRGRPQIVLHDRAVPVRPLDERLLPAFSGRQRAILGPGDGAIPARPARRLDRLARVWRGCRRAAGLCGRRHGRLRRRPHCRRGAGQVDAGGAQHGRQGRRGAGAPGGGWAGRA